MLQFHTPPGEGGTLESEGRDLLANRLQESKERKSLKFTKDKVVSASLRHFTSLEEKDSLEKGKRARWKKISESGTNRINRLAEELADHFNDPYYLQGTLPLLFEEWDVAKESSALIDALQKIVKVRHAEEEDSWIFTHIVEPLLLREESFSSLAERLRLPIAKLDFIDLLRSDLKRETKSELVEYAIAEAVAIDPLSIYQFDSFQNALGELFYKNYALVELKNALYLAKNPQGFTAAPRWKKREPDLFIDFPNKREEIARSLEEKKPLIARNPSIADGSWSAIFRTASNLLDLFFPGEFRALLLPKGIYILKGTGERGGHLEKIQECNRENISSEAMLEKLA